MCIRDRPRFFNIIFEEEEEDKEEDKEEEAIVVVVVVVIAFCLSVCRGKKMRRKRKREREKKREEMRYLLSTTRNSENLFCAFFVFFRFESHMTKKSSFYSYSIRDSDLN